MKYLKSISAIFLISGLVAIFACGSNDDPYNSSRIVSNTDENNDYSNWPAPGPGGSSSGGTTNNSIGPEDTTDNQAKLLKDLDQPQVNVICAANYEHYKKHDDPRLGEGRGACLDFAARRAYEIAFDPETRFMICEEKYVECVSLSAQSPPTASCMNPRAQVTCEATVAEFKSCATQDAKILTSYFLQLHNQTCTDYITDYDLAQLDVLLDKYPQPKECITLLTKCPQIFD